MVSSRIMKHRKLFLTPTINDSIVCPDFCEPTCPTYCFPYPDTYLLPPPLPQPPLSSNHDQSLSPYVVIIATLLGVTFLIVSYYLVIVKSCGCWNWFRPRRGELGDIDESFADANRGPVIDHPVWYIRTIGLQPSIINSISVVKYKKGDSLTEGADCSICLNEFQDDETLRLLPKCNHSFHISCIDTWLRSHTNCPVCRSGIISNSNSSRQVQETDNQTESAEVDENRRISDEEIELSQVDIRVQAETSNTRNLSDQSHGNNIVHEDPIQQKRRSISADSLMVAKIKLAIENLSVAENEQKFEPADSSKYTASTSGSALLQNESVSLKRSSSYGGRSFFSRHSRSLSLIHPL